MIAASSRRQGLHAGGADLLHRQQEAGNSGPGNELDLDAERDE